MRNCTFTLLLLLHAFCLRAQYFEAGLRLGGSNYLGDLTPSRLWTSLGETNIYTGAIVRYSVNDWLALRGGVNFGRIAANDASSISFDQVRRRRNLNFRSNISELELTGEYNLWRYRPLHLKNRFAPYAFIGVGVFHFRPQALYQEKWHNLQPLGTEGQGIADYPNKYRLTQISIPLGVGFKYALTENLNLGFEYGMRKTFTDYLDDTSKYYPDLQLLKQERGELACKLSWRTDEIDPNAKPPKKGQPRGDPNDMDWYIFTGLTLSYNFIEGNLYHPAKPRKNRLDCPKVRKPNRVLGGMLIRGKR